MEDNRKKSIYDSDDISAVIDSSSFPDDENDYSDFYDHISVFYRILSFFFIILFLIYIVISSFKNAKEFNFENFDYIARNFALTLEELKDDSGYVIEYNIDANRDCALFGEGLAVCGESWLSIYSATGRLTCSETFKYKNPQIATSDKFVLIYDFSDFEYSLYNAFGKVYSEEIGEVIRGGAVSDSGYYALITSSEQYNTAVELYDDTFSLAYRFNKNQFVTDIDINDNYLLITSVSVSSENSYDMEIHVFDIIAQKVLFSTLARNNFPLECGIFAGGFAVIGDNYTSFYDFEGNIKGSFDYEGRAPIDLSLNDGNTVILLRSNSSDAECISVILDDSCSLRYEHLLSEKVHDVEVCGEWSYYLMNDRLIYTNGNDLYDIPLNDINEGDKLLSLNDKSIYLCTVSKAPLFDLSND